MRWILAWSIWAYTLYRSLSTTTIISPRTYPLKSLTLLSLALTLDSSPLSPPWSVLSSQLHSLPNTSILYSGHTLHYQNPLSTCPVFPLLPSKRCRAESVHLDDAQTTTINQDYLDLFIAKLPQPLPEYALGFDTRAEVLGMWYKIINAPYLLVEFLKNGTLEEGMRNLEEFRVGDRVKSVASGVGDGVMMNLEGVESGNLIGSLASRVKDGVMMSLKALKLGDRVGNVEQDGVVRMNLEEVQIGGRFRNHMAMRNGTVSKVYPSTTFEDFQYLVDWDVKDVKTRAMSSKVKATTLARETTKITFALNRKGIVPKIQYSNDSVVVFSSNRVLFLMGYSHAFRQYWQVEGEQETTPPSADDALPPSTFPPWRRISSSTPKQWNPLLGLAVLCCEKFSFDDFEDEDDAYYTCSKFIGLDRLHALQEQLYPVLDMKNRPLTSCLFWFCIMLVSNILRFAVFNTVFVVFAFTPVVYSIVNSFRHVDDPAQSFGTVLRCCFPIADLFLTYLLAMSFREALGPMADTRGAFQCVYFACIGRACWMLINARARDEKSYEAERAAMLKTRHRVRSVNMEPEPICRICFGEGNLVSPCLCNGSMRYVHADCLAEWRYRSINAKSYVRCDQCQFRYKSKRTKWSILLRSSFCTSLLTMWVLICCFFLGMLVFKVLDCFAWRSRLNEEILGPRISYFMQLGDWDATPRRRRITDFEKVLMGFSRTWLEPMGLQMCHLVCSVVVVGAASFLYSDAYAIPWLWGGEGWFMFVDDRLGIIVAVGSYRFFAYVWDKVALGMASMFSKWERENTLVSVEPLKWERPKGLRLKTPFGLIRVVNHRLEDDVLETQSLDGLFTLYRSAAESAEADEEL